MNKKYDGGINMLTYSGEELEAYKRDCLEIQPDWNERDFVQGVRNYLDAMTEKVLAVSGLPGTGKTVGIFQATKNYDLLYILAQIGESETGADYVYLLKETEKKYIFIDEYFWIKERYELDRYLQIAVQNGKKIVLAARESIAFDFMKPNVMVSHITPLTYQEYLRLHNWNHSKAICTKFLTEGFLPEKCAFTMFEIAKCYIDYAIVHNLAVFLKHEMSEEEKVHVLTYAVLYRVICPSNLSSIPALQHRQLTLPEFLEKMGVHTAMTPEESDLNGVADIFAQTGIIVRIPSFNREGPQYEKYYIVNPAITCQLMLYVYGLPSIDGDILAHLYESCVAVQLFTNKQCNQKLFFYAGEEYRKFSGSEGLNLLMTDSDKHFAYFFECRFYLDDCAGPVITIRPCFWERYECSDMEDPFVVNNGNAVICKDDFGDINVFTPTGDIRNCCFDDFNAETLCQFLDF